MFPCLYLGLLLLACHQVVSQDVQEVVVTEQPAGYRHAKTDQDLQLLVRTCLEPDLAMHTNKTYQLSDLAATVQAQQRIKYWKHMSLVVIRAGVMHVASLSPAAQPPSPTPRRMAAMVQAVHNATLAGVTFPDCVFVMSTWDEPRCLAARPERCPAPVLSLIKTWEANSNTSHYLDILVPFFNHVYQVVMEYPWELKQPKALMRAAMQNGMKVKNTRLTLVQLSKSELGEVLDAGITNNLRVGLHLELVPQVSLPDHAKWRYLVSADGFTASCRLGKLLGINSVVLKERSRWVEYYYRALQPGTHYIPFTGLDIHKVLQSLKSTPETELQAITKAAQAFQQRYLSQHAKAVYLRLVLQRYVQLFPAGLMNSWVQSLDVSRMMDLSYLLQRLSEAPQRQSEGA